ncbi:MAG: hypothetical protein M3081_10240 [Gemmatimonadota bacterium]|nr:hypothetical protein [Gemmatimonadota bacterium]
MIFFRGRQPETSIWRRFRTAADGFSFTKEPEYFVAHLVANAERTVDLFHALLEHLPPAVDVAVIDARTKRTWKGGSLALPDVRDAIARIKAPLAESGGVEIAVYTSEDQVTLNPVLELFIYARTDQWLYILQGKGLEERRAVRTKSWKLARQSFPPAPQLSIAVDALVSALRLAPE